MKRHNPERRAWRGRSYRRGGQSIAELRDELDRLEAMRSIPIDLRERYNYLKSKVKP